MIVNFQSEIMFFSHIKPARFQQSHVLICSKKKSTMIRRWHVPVCTMKHVIGTCNYTRHYSAAYCTTYQFSEEPSQKKEKRAQWFADGTFLSSRWSTWLGPATLHDTTVLPTVPLTGLFSSPPNFFQDSSLHQIFETYACSIKYK